MPLVILLTDLDVRVTVLRHKTLIERRGEVFTKGSEQPILSFTADDAAGLGSCCVGGRPKRVSGRERHDAAGGRRPVQRWGDAHGAAAAGVGVVPVVPVGGVEPGRERGGGEAPG
jgi:hypothetical protein